MSVGDCIFFSERFDRGELERAQANDEAAVRRMRGSYLGFVVVRPIPASPLGRTVLRWYHDREAATAPRSRRRRATTTATWAG